MLSDCGHFWIRSILARPAAQWRLSFAIERLQEFPDLGMKTGDADIRQIVVRFGSSGYIVRYAILAETGDVLVTRIWHGREARI
jgi:hypothetical protein